MGSRSFDDFVRAGIDCGTLDPANINPSPAIGAVRLDPYRITPSAAILRAIATCYPAKLAPLDRKCITAGGSRSSSLRRFHYWQGMRMTPSSVPLTGAVCLTCAIGSQASRYTAST